MTTRKNWIALINIIKNISKIVKFVPENMASVNSFRFNYECTNYIMEKLCMRKLNDSAKYRIWSSNRVLYFSSEHNHFRLGTFIILFGYPNLPEKQLT